MGTVLYVTAEVLRVVGILVQPLVPQSAAKLLDLLAIVPGHRSFNQIGIRLVPGTILQPPSAIFPRFVEEGETPPKA
jgi:methionyl-tRNA synthetase